MLYIHGIGHYHPENKITNQFLEGLDIGTTNEWIIDRVGIHQRRTDLSLDYIQSTLNKQPELAKPNWEANTMKAIDRASQMALKRANLTADNIGMVIGGSSSPVYSVPTLASLVADRLGINRPCYDINSGCAMFNVHLDVVNKFHHSATPDYILMLISDHITRSINFSDRSTAVLFGDCTTAVILSKTIPSQMEVDFTFIDSSPDGWRLVNIPHGGYVSMVGREVQKFAIKKTIASLKKMANETTYTPSNHYFIGHQANLSMLDFITKNLAIPSDKHLYNVDQYGNCGGASAPSVLSQNWECFKSGDEIGLSVVGTGLTWGATHIRVQ